MEQKKLLDEANATQAARRNAGAVRQKFGIYSGQLFDYLKSLASGEYSAS